MEPQEQVSQEPQPMQTDQSASTFPQAVPAAGTVPATNSAPQANNGVDPGHSLGVIGLIFAFFVPVVGLIISLIALSKSKKAGMKNGLAKAGLIISIFEMVLGLIIFIGFFSLIANSPENRVECYRTNSSGIQGETAECNL